MCSSCSVGDFCSGSVCCNRRSGTGTSKTGWEAVCRRHVPHRSSYGRVSTQSDTSCLRRQTSSCRPCLCHTIQAADGGMFSVNHRWQGGRFPYNVLTMDRGNRNSGASFTFLWNIYWHGKRLKQTIKPRKIESKKDCLLCILKRRQRSQQKNSTQTSWWASASRVETWQITQYYCSGRSCTAGYMIIVLHDTMIHIRCLPLLAKIRQNNL